MGPDTHYERVLQQLENQLLEQMELLSSMRQEDKTLWNIDNNILKLQTSEPSAVTEPGGT